MRGLPPPLPFRSVKGGISPSGVPCRAHSPLSFRALWEGSGGFGVSCYLYCHLGFFCVFFSPCGALRQSTTASLHARHFHHTPDIYRYIYFFICSLLTHSPHLSWLQPIPCREVLKVRFKDDELEQIGSTGFQGHETNQIKGEFYLWIRERSRPRRE